MATEEEAREAPDGEEVQVEAMDLRKDYLQMCLDGKLSSSKKIKDEVTTMDPTEGTLKITEDQVLENEPFVVDISPEHTPNGTASFLNGHMDKEDKILNGLPQENSQKQEDPVEDSPDQTSTDKRNISYGGEVTDPSGHGESSTEDTSLLKYENGKPTEYDQQDFDLKDDNMVQESTLRTKNFVEPAVDVQPDQNLQSTKATEDTQPGNISNIPNDEVVTEAPVEVKTSLETSVDDTDALLVTSDGNTKGVEPVKLDAAADLEHKELPEVEATEEHTDDVKLEDSQHNNQTNGVNAEVVQEEIEETKETDELEDIPKIEQADDRTSDAQEVLIQESPEESRDPVSEKNDETSHKSNVAPSEESIPEHEAATREPAFDIEEKQNQRSMEEMTDAKQIGTDKTMQGCVVAFEEAIPIDHAATTEPSSNTLHVSSVESEENMDLEDSKAKETCNESYEAFAKDALQDKKVLQSEVTSDIQPLQGLEQEEYVTLRADNVVESTVDVQPDQNLQSAKATEDMQPANMTNIPDDEVVTEAHVEVQASLETSVDDTDALSSDGNKKRVEPAKVDDAADLEQKEKCPEVEAIAEHTKYIQLEDSQHSKQSDGVNADTVQEEIHERNESNVLEDMPKTEQEIEGSKETNVLDDMPKTEQADELTSDAQEVPIQESPKEPRDLVSEKSTETSHESNVASSEKTTTEHEADTREPPFDFKEVQNQRSVEKVTDAKEYETEKSVQGSDVASEEVIPEDHEATSEPSSNTVNVSSVESEENIDPEDAKAKETCNQTYVAFAKDAVQDKDVLPSGPTRDIQPLQGLEQEENKQTENDVMDEASNQTHTDVFNNLAEEDGAAASQPQEIELKEEMKDSEATKTQEITHQSHVVASEELVREDNSTVSEIHNDDVQQILEQRLVQVEDAEATQPETEVIYRERNISASKEGTIEDDVMSEGPNFDVQEIQNVESEEVKKRIAENAVEDHIDEQKHVDTADFTAEPLAEPQTIEIDTTNKTEDTDVFEAEQTKITATELLKNEKTIDIHQESIPSIIDARIQNSVEVNEGIEEQKEPNNTCSLDGDAEKYTEEEKDHTIKNVVVARGSSDEHDETTNESRHEEDELPNSVGHASSQMSSDQHEENIPPVQERDSEEELLTERGTAEASKTLFEDDPQPAQDDAKKEDLIESDEQINDQDNEQLQHETLQTQIFEQTVDALATVQQDEAVRNVNLDTEQEEDDKGTKEIHTGEQKHAIKRADSSEQPLVEPQSIEIDTTNKTENSNAFQAEQIETVSTEILKNEQTIHIPRESILSITDAKVENSVEVKEGISEEKAPSNTCSLDVDVRNYTEDEQDHKLKDEVLAKVSTDEQDEIIDEFTNEENPTVVPNNVESIVHIEEKQSTNDVNQESEEVIIHEVEERQETENNNEVVDQGELQPIFEEEATSQLHSNEPYNADTKMDGIMSPCAELIHGITDAQPRESEELEQINGFSSISESDVATTTQNNVELDLSIHDKVVDAKLEATNHNGEVVEAMPQTVCSSYAETDDDNLSISNPLPEHVTGTDSDINQSRKCKEAIIKDDVLQLKQEENEIEKNAEIESNEKIETNYTAVTEAVNFNEDICSEASGADEGLSDQNLKIFEDTRKNLDVSSEVTALGGKGSVNEEKEDHKLSLPAHYTPDIKTTEQASDLEETDRELAFKPLIVEPKVHEESQRTEEQDGEDIHEEELCDTHKEDQKEGEQSDLPVSHFLMNLILGNSEPEAERKQEETKKDDSPLITSPHEESLVPFATKNNEDDGLIVEQEKHNLEDSKETSDMVKEQTHDFKLKTDEGLGRNTHDLKAPVYQDDAHVEVSSELVPSEAPGLVTEVETTDFEMCEREVDSICQEHVEVATKVEEGNLKGSQDDSTSPKTSKDDTLEEGGTQLLHVSLPEDMSSDAVAEQKLLLTKTDMADEKKLPMDNDDLQSPLGTEQEESTESSITETKDTTQVLKSEGEDMEEESQRTTTCGGPEGQIENFPDNLQKGTGPEEISDGQKPEITEPASGTEINLVHEKEILAGSLFKNGIEKAPEIHLDDPNLHIKENKEDETTKNQVEMERNNFLDKPEGSNLLGKEEINIAQKSPEESDDREPMIKEENVHEAIQIHMQKMNMKFKEEKETLDSQVQESDLNVVSPKEALESEKSFMEMTKPGLSEDGSTMTEERTYDTTSKDEEEANDSSDETEIKIEEREVGHEATHKQERNPEVVSPKEAPEAEEKSVQIKKPEFSTNEHQSPKKAESEEKTNNKKLKAEEEATHFTDEATMETGERGGQKASPKKHNILSGVGSKVKNQLAKVKKAIIGKPAHTKSESPKAESPKS